MMQQQQQNFDVQFAFRWQSDFPTFLRVVALCNIAYCVLSLWKTWQHHHAVTTLGWAYILGEIVLVLLLARLELKVAGAMRNWRWK